MSLLRIIIVSKPKHNTIQISDVISLFDSNHFCVFHKQTHGTQQRINYTVQYKCRIRNTFITVSSVTLSQHVVISTSTLQCNKQQSLITAPVSYTGGNITTQIRFVSLVMHLPFNHSCQLLRASKDTSYDDKMFLTYELAGFVPYKHTIHGALPIVWFVEHHFGKWSEEEGFFRRIEE